jgi:hypothetical protein
MKGQKGGPACQARQAGDKISSQLSTVEAAKRSWDARRSGGQAQCDIKTSLCTEYVLLCMLTYFKLDNCNRERCLLCFRRINHMVVKDHWHSSSDVQEVVSSTMTRDRVGLFIIQEREFLTSILSESI